MGEEEIINYLSKEIINNDIALWQWFEDLEYDEETKLRQAIKGLLDLYNEEKTKNKKLDMENQALYESINCDDKNMLERLYKEEKEKNNKLEEELDLKIKELDLKIKALDIAMSNPDYICKDKIKEKIKELEKEYEEYKDSQEWEIFDETKYAYDLLKELLEGE